MRLLPPAIAFILVLTAVSVEICDPFLDEYAFRRIERFDMVLNVLLYLPIGFALSRRGFLVVGAVAGALSLFSESAQVFYPDRYASLFDLAANLTGALLGAALARAISSFSGLRASAMRMNAATGIFAAMACAALVATLSRPGEPADFSNWDPTHELAVGGEPAGGRRWRGSISELSIYDRCLETPAIDALAKTNRQAAAPQLREPVFAMSSITEEDSLWGKPLLDAKRRDALFRAVTGQDHLTVLARFRSHETRPEAPADIVTFSKDSTLRNFTLGLEGGRIVFRLRTPRTGPNGLYPQIHTADVVRPDQQVFVAATYNGRVARVYADGHLLTRENLAAKSRAIPFLADSGLPAAAFATGMLAAVWALCFLGSRLRVAKWPVAALTGVGAAGLLVFLGAASNLPECAAWLPFFGLSGGLVAAASAFR
jgi:VanZ family protein